MALDFPALKKVLVTRYESTVEGDWREQLSLYSRYPQGLSDEQWHRLLEETGQQDFDHPVTNWSSTP